MNVATDLLILLTMLSVCFALGLWPSLVFQAPSRTAVVRAFCLSSAFGLGILLFLAFTCYRFIGPSQTWFTPLVLGAGSLSLAFAFRKMWRDKWVRSHKNAVIKGGISALGACCLLIVLLYLPMYFGKSPYKLYYNNASDAFFYISFADTTKVIPWNILHPNSTLSDISGAATLAALSNTSLFTARFLNCPLQISHCIALGGFSVLTGIPVYRIFHVLNLFSFVAASGVFVLLCSRLKLSRWQAALSSIAMSVGYWAQICREHDALASNLAIPVTFVFCLALVDSDSARRQDQRRALIFLAVATALLIGTYFLMALIMGVVACVYLTFRLIDRRVRKINVFKVIVAGLGGLILIALSGQAPYLWRCLWFFIEVSSRSNTTWLAETQLITSPLSTIWGLTPFFDDRLVGILLPFSHWLIGGFAIILTLSFFLSIFRLIKMQRRPLHNFLIATIVCATFIIVSRSSKKEIYQIGKSIQLFFPFIFLIMTSLFQTMTVSSSKSILLLLRRPVRAMLIIWLVSQLLIVMPTTFLAHEDKLVATNRPPRGQQFDLNAITAVLDQDKPKMIYVNVPPTSDWIFPFYIMTALQHYPVYFVSGVIVDNSINSNRNILSPPALPPSMLLQAKGAPVPSNIRSLNKRAETSELELYDVEATSSSSSGT